MALLERDDLPKLPPPSVDKPKRGAADKLRADHRHHAIDAVVVGLTTPNAIAALSRYFEQTRAARTLRLPCPWAKLPTELRERLDKLVVSHRTDRRLNGQLHDLTHYGRRKDGAVVLRRPLSALAEADLNSIRDRRIREAVLRKWAERPEGVTDVGKYFGTDANLPRLSIPNRQDGSTREIVIRRVLTNESAKPVAIGQGATLRHVKTGDNYCVAVIETQPNNAKAKPRWVLRAVTRLEAIKRVGRSSAGPKMHRSAVGLFDLIAGERIVFTVRSSEILRLAQGKHAGLIRIGTASDSGLEGARINDARPESVRKVLGAGERIRLSSKELQTAGAHKVTLGPLGEVTPCND